MKVKRIFDNNGSLFQEIVEKVLIIFYNEKFNNITK